MWINKIHIRLEEKHRLFDQLKSNEINLFIGDTECGKTTILKGIAESWQSCLSETKRPDSVQLEIRHLDLTMSSSDNSGAIKIKNLFVNKNNDVSCAMLFYPVERILKDMGNAEKDKSTTEKCFSAMSSDFENHSIHNSIIIIDDIDLKPSKKRIETFINTHFPKLIKNKNQIIMSCINEKILDGLSVPIKKFRI
jgi:hypothetical protein